MALSKDKKAEVISEVANLIDSSKITVLADYRGVSVKSMQALRKSAKQNSTVVKVFKNRLVKKALENTKNCQSTDTSALKEQLLYAFNSDDEVAPAQALADFAKSETNLEFVGAITADGRFIGVNDVKTLASLPSKEQLRAQLVGTISAPLSGFVNVMNGNLRGFLNVLGARSENL